MIEKIVESIKKIKDSGDEVKLLYAKSLYQYYTIFCNLFCLFKKNKILKEKEVKYHCETFYHYLDNNIDYSIMIISAIISAVANDEPLDSFYKYLMFPKLYEEECKSKNQYQYQK